MAAVALHPSDLFELDTDASIIEAAAKRVRRAVLNGSLVAVGGVACFYVKRAHTLGNDFRARLSRVEVNTAEDRELLKDIARNLSQASLAFEQAYEEAERGRLVKIPVFGHRLMTELENLVCTFEDISETAALGANEAFAAALKDELRRNLERKAIA